MTTTDYSLLAASAAIILTVAACWWRRASETARIYVTELSWDFSSLCAACTHGSCSPRSAPSVCRRPDCSRCAPSEIGVLLPIGHAEGQRPARRSRGSAARMNPGAE